VLFNLTALPFSCRKEELFTARILVPHLIFNRMNWASVSVLAGQATDLVFLKRGKSELIMWHPAFSGLRR